MSNWTCTVPNCTVCLHNYYAYCSRNYSRIKPKWQVTPQVTKQIVHTIILLPGKALIVLNNRICDYFKKTRLWLKQLNSPVFPVNRQTHFWALPRMPYCVWGRDWTCHEELASSSAPRLQVLYPDVYTPVWALPFVARSRACLCNFIWNLWDIRPLYCHCGLQLWVFTLSSLWTSSYAPMRGVGHTIIWLALIIAVWEQDCITPGRL